MERVLLKDLGVGECFYINGRRYGVYGKVIRDGQAFIAVYQNKAGKLRKLSYLQFDTEVLIDSLPKGEK